MYAVQLKTQQTRELGTVRSLSVPHLKLKTFKYRATLALYLPNQAVAETEHCRR